MDKIGYLRQTDLFADMPRAELHKISRSMQMTNYLKGKIVYRPDDPGDVLFILKHGRVRIFRLAPDGRELTIAELTSGTVFGEMGLLGQTMYGSFAEALEDCLICVMTRDLAVRLLREKPEIALRLIEIVGRRLLAAENRLESLGLRDVPRRLAALLLELAQPSEDGAHVARHTHEELAKMIGTSRESVTLAIGHFRNRGWLRLDNHEIDLVRPSELREFIEQ